MLFSALYNKHIQEITEDALSLLSMMKQSTNMLQDLSRIELDLALKNKLEMKIDPITKRHSNKSPKKSISYVQLKPKEH